MISSRGGAKNRRSPEGEHLAADRGSSPRRADSAPDNDRARIAQRRFDRPINSGAPRRSCVSRELSAEQTSRDFVTILSRASGAKTSLRSTGKEPARAALGRAIGIARSETSRRTPRAREEASPSGREPVIYCAERIEILFENPPTTGFASGDTGNNDDSRVLECFVAYPRSFGLEIFGDKPREKVAFVFSRAFIHLFFFIFLSHLLVLFLFGSFCVPRL